MTVRKSKKRKIYYSCSGYPDCKFMSWDIPTGEKCPQCGQALVQTARGNVKCSNKECDYKIKAEKPEKEGEKTAQKSVRQTPAHVSSVSEGGLPPLTEEPLYDGYDEGGYVTEGFDDGE